MLTLCLKTPSRSRLAAMIAALFLGTAATGAYSADLLGLYAGASLGEAHAQTTRSAVDPVGLPGIQPVSASEASHPAYSFFVGVKPTKFLGVEMEHVNFGPGNDSSSAATRAVTRGNAAFAVGYLPVPVVDAYVKVGLARLESESSGLAFRHPTCSSEVCPLFYALLPYASPSVNTEIAEGVGVQYHLGSWAIRAQYERFTTNGSHPDVASIGLLKHF